MILPTLLALTIADQATYLAPVAQEMTKEWPQNRAVTIVCHGHSVPAGYGRTPVIDSLAAYPNQLRVALADKFPHAVINVIVTAIGGENSIQGAKRFAKDVLSLHPDVVTIDYGLNDRGFPAPEVKKAWTQMVTDAKAAGAKVILLTPSPDLRATMLDASDPLSVEAAQIRDVAAETGVGLVDSYARFQEILREGKKMEPFMAQVNHPNRAGHTEIAKLLIPWFTQVKA